MHHYQVIVGNLGTVLDRKSEYAPMREYLEWVREARGGRADGEAVTLIRDGEPIREHGTQGD